MMLHTAAREYYHLEVVTSPPVTGWEASFDQGRTWHPSQPTGTGHRWLLAGPTAPDDGTPAARVRGTCSPLLRAVDNTWQPA